MATKKSMKLGGGGRFAKLAKSIAKGGATNPAAVAASIGRKKYGAKKFTAMAVAGKKRVSRARKSAK
jgi:hypothetical protein